MAKLETVISRRSAREQQAIREKLYRLSDFRATTFQAYGSLVSESRLPESAWDELLNILLSSSNNPVELQRAISDFCKRWTLAGDEMPTVKLKTLGRAITEKWLVAHTRKLLVGRPRINASREVRDLYTKPFSIVKARWSGRDLGRYLMWSTFDPKGENPFRRFPRSADSIRRVLGLDPNFSGDPLLLLDYTLPSTANPRFPTIADAYAGDEWSYFFTPAPESAPYGMTMAWPEYASRTRPRPEVVHEVIKGVQMKNQARKVL
jgi:hypothetical protein